MSRVPISVVTEIRRYRIRFNLQKLKQRNYKIFQKFYNKNKFKEQMFLESNRSQVEKLISFKQCLN